MTHPHSFPVAPVLVAALLLAGCAGSASGDCPIAGQKAMTVVRLYFGRDIAGREPVSDQEWSDFARTVLTPQFPDGLTVLKGNGQWLDTDAGRVVREDSIIVEVAVDSASDYARRVDTAIAAYKQQFRQEAVGVITEPVCARF